MDYAKVGAALLAGLKAMWPALHDAIIAIAAAQVQKRLDEGRNAKGSLEGIKRADDAAAQPVPDVLRDLQSRGRLRDV